MTFYSSTGYHYEQLLWHQSHTMPREGVLSPNPSPKRGDMTSSLNDFLGGIASVVWGPFILIPLLLGTGLYLTIRLGGIQLTKLFQALRLAFFCGISAAAA